MKPIYLLLTLLATLLPATRLRGADLTAGRHTLTGTETIYKLEAENDEVAEYDLTTSGTEITTRLKILTNTSGTVIVTLKDFQIKHEAPVTILGTGTVIFNSVGDNSVGDSVNSITYTGTAAGAVIDALNSSTSAAATVRFQNTMVLRIIADNSASSGSNVIPIRAKQVFFEAGEVACRAVCTKKFSNTLYLTPAVQAESITICGETTVLTPTFLTRSGMLPTDLMKLIATYPRSFFDCSALHFTGGKIRQDDATAFPSINVFKKDLRYHYPASAYDLVLNQSNGGALLTEKQATFYFPDWTSFGSADDYLNSFTSSNANAVLDASLLTVDADAKTITIATDSSFPDPALRYTEGSAPDAVTLFGVTPEPTANGLRVSYAFGIDWIGPVQSCIGARLAVELPAETDETVSFGITILNAANESVYRGTLPFTRVASGSPLFRSEKVATAQTLANLGLGTAHYRVIATEPAAK